MKHSGSSQQLARLEAACREHGLPVTIQRREVYGVLVLRSDHPTADEIYEAVRAKLGTISRATVYRVLETLVQIGVARTVSHPGAAARFDPVTERHHHFTCSGCGRIADLFVPELDDLPLPRDPGGARIADYSVHFLGTCGPCNKKSRPAKAPGPAGSRPARSR